MTPVGPLPQGLKALLESRFPGEALVQAALLGPDVSAGPGTGHKAAGYGCHVR
jgi:hypothetical protein